TVELLSGQAPLAAPVMMSAAFMASGIFVEVVFSAPSDKAKLNGIFSCDKLFEFNGAGSSQCQWSSTSAVRVALPPSSLLVPGNSFSLRGGLVRAFCGAAVDVSFCAQWTASPRSTVAVARPVSPPVPAVVLSTPSLIGSCDNMIVNFVGSTGSGGRVWKSAVVTVDGVSTNISSVKAFVAIQPDMKESGRIVVPNRLLESGYTYKWTVRLCNFFDNCGVASSRVGISNSVIPLVSLLGQPLRTTYRSQVFQATSLANVRLCDGTLSSSNLDYYWNVYDAAGVEVSVASTSRDPKTLRLPAYSLDVAKSYRIVSTVLHTGSLLSSSATASVFVARGAMVAVVGGSTTQTFRADQNFQLDGSGSYDADDPVAVMGYKWTCIRQKPVPSSSCGVEFVSSDSGRVLSVRALSSNYITESVISLTVTGVDDRTSTTSVTLSVIEPLSPLVVITSPSKKINPFDRLQVKGSFLSAETGVAEWSVDDPSIALEEMTTTAVVVPYSQRADTSVPVAVNLVLPAGSLFARSTFTFTLRYTTDRLVSASSSVRITTNGPPVNGIMTVSPDSGEMLSTPFSMSASQWQDEDLPISYQYAHSTAVDVSFSVFRSKSELSYCESVLPGRPDVDSIVSVQVKVFDGLGASEAAVSSVVVRPAVV
ncbi:unnamed protein product, partial [Ectocarpus fasciculatus]